MVTSRIGTALLLLAFCVAPAAAEELSRERRADIEHLLDITGSRALGKQMARLVVEQLKGNLRSRHPDIPQAVIDRLPDDIEAVFDENMDAFVATVVPLYAKHFTGEEIRQMIAFYSTDLGKKTIAVMPALMSESMLAGQAWGRSLGPEIDARVRARAKEAGFEL